MKSSPMERGWMPLPDRLTVVVVSTGSSEVMTSDATYDDIIVSQG